MQTLKAEFQLLNWTESASGGAKIIFAVSPEDMEQFKSLTRREGKRPGQRLMAALVPIDDQEQPVDTPSPEEMRQIFRDAEPKGGALCKLAAMLCSEPEFYAWLCSDEAPVAGMEEPEVDNLPDRDWCAEKIRRLCGVKSRRELDHNPAAARIFHEKIRKPYWNQTQS